VVLTTSRLTLNTGHEFAISALGRLNDSGRPVIYLVCGDGGRESELRHLARSVRLHAVFTGLLESEEIVGALAAADVVVHPSLHEIFPNAVGEAMACGRPVVATDAGGTGELLGRDGDTGVLVPPGDAAALAEAVRELLADPARRDRLGDAARRRIEAEFPLGRMIDRYEAALLAVIE
jgi:glycosyltransferase involved in cell wall biosynthesis